MEPIIRKKFNADFNENKYRSLLDLFPENFGIKVPFRIAESPIFLTSEFKAELIKAGQAIIDQIFRPEFLEYSLKGIPKDLNVPGPMGNPNFLAIDFGICAGQNGKPTPQLIELQGFPSLYGFQSFIGEAYQKIFQFPKSWNQFFGDLDAEGYITRLKEGILGEEDPKEVVLLEIDPWNQSTAIDFAITAQICGISVVDIREVMLENGKLYYPLKGKKTRIKRIYNRVIFDELNRRKDIHSDFHLTEPAEVDWAIHPNWFFRYSKFLLPKLSSPYVPPSFYLNELVELPNDLENYVLKPLFSFSGEGIIFNVQKENIIGIKDKENFILQKKVSYLPILESPVGGVKAEIRLLYLWDKLTNKPILTTNLCRFSRGDMIGVKFNKEKTWVGGSIALFQ